MDDRQVEAEIIEIRERLIRLEVLLEGVHRSVDRAAEKEKPGGAVIIPVAAVVALAEIARFFIERGV